MSESATVPNRPRLAASMARRRQNILDAAVSLFHERGYLGTTVDDIAARAGVTKRTLYHHMGNKENILGEIHATFIQIGLERWRAVVEEGGSAAHVVERLLEEHVLVVAEHRDAISVFLEEAKHLNEASRAEIGAQRDRYEVILQDAIRRAIDEGGFRADLDVRVTTVLVLGGLTEMYRWFRPASRAARDHVVSLSTSLALHGIQAGPGAA